MDLRETYNRIAEDWHKDHQEDDWWIEGTNVFISFLKQGNEILDVGCGGGFKSNYLQKRGLRVEGIDFSEKLIDIAKKEVPEATFMLMDMRDVRKIPKKYDGIFAQASLLHIPKNEIAKTLSALVSKTKRNGYVYVAVKGMKKGRGEEEVKEEKNYGYPYERFFSYFSLEELRKHFKNLQLQIVYEKIERAGNTDWIQVIGQKK